MKKSKDLSKKLKRANRANKSLNKRNIQLQKEVSFYKSKYSELQIEDFQLLGNIILLLTKYKCRLALDYLKENYEKRKSKLFHKSEEDIYFEDLEKLYEKKSYFDKLNNPK